MDPDTEKYYAALIMEEAARLRVQADKEGVLAYLAKPSVRAKPNPQFLKATVSGIAQANRAAEVNEMWKRRTRELQYEERERRHRSSSYRSDGHSERSTHHCGTRSKKARRSPRNSSVPREMSSRLLDDENAVDYTSEEEGARCQQRSDHDYQLFRDDLRDEGLHEVEVEQFLLSRVKRGRGTVGSRMDETGPYPSASACLEPNSFERVKDNLRKRCFIGPSMEGDRGQLLPQLKTHNKKQKAASQSSESEQSYESKKAEKKRKKHKGSYKTSKRYKKNDDAS